MTAQNLVIERSSSLLPSNARNRLKAKGVTHSRNAHLLPLNMFCYVLFQVKGFARDVRFRGKKAEGKYLGERAGYISVSSISLQ